MSSDSEETWFVILMHQNGSPTPLVNDGELAVFGSEQEARDAGDRNPLGAAYGYEVYQWE